jgi:hypothetical protein
MTDTLLSATCGTYLINLNVIIIISERKVIILYIEVIQSALMCHCKKKKYILLSIFNSDVVVMSRGNRNFHLRLFVKGEAL